MQEKYLYEYAVIRVLPKVEREEFLNVGIILFSKRAKYIKARYWINVSKFNLFTSDLDLELLTGSLDAFIRVSTGSKESGVVGAFEIPERFRWLTAVRSSCIQTSRPHPGFSNDLDATFDKLFNELVL